MRSSTIERRTNETNISFSLDLDGRGECKASSGIAFFDHMINLLAKHSSFTIDLVCKGDIEIDNHHSIEDIGIVMGMAIKKALASKEAINRYGTFYCPMDEALSRVCVDLSGRGYLVYDVKFSREKAGDLETDSLKEFFYALAINAGINLHITNLYGENTHHIIESIFKAFARSMREAVKLGDPSVGIPSTKGLL